MENSTGLPRCLTIAGSDSSGGAGIQADLKTFAAMRTYGMSAITAVTAQNTLEVSAIHVLPMDMISAQIRAVMVDIGVDAVKTGMLGTAEVIATVADSLKTIGKLRLVVDPVMIATSGATLLASNATETMTYKLFPLASVITPNVFEAEALTSSTISSKDDVMKTAKILLQQSSAVLIKGGHLQTADKCYDYFIDPAGTEFWLEYARIDTRNSHGTGCTYAAAITARLALGEPLSEAIKNARKWLQGAILSSAKWTMAKGSGPLDHGWQATSPTPTSR